MAFAMLEFGVMNNAGFTVITGEVGRKDYARSPSFKKNQFDGN